jgi:thymidylate kinase
MPADKSPIFLITGTPGAGKTSVASALVKRFPLGLHIPLDDLRNWVVSGNAPPIPTWTNETTRQFRLARQAAVQIARYYASAGFAVAIDDVLFPSEAEATIISSLWPYPVHKILLKPDVEIALERNVTRTNKNFDTSILADTIRKLHHSMPASLFARAGWLVVDNTSLSLEATVDRILSQL